jgi:LysM repeat protein
MLIQGCRTDQWHHAQGRSAVQPAAEDPAVLVVSARELDSPAPPAAAPAGLPLARTAEQANAAPIIISEPAAPLAPASASRVHVVRHGDTLSGIAKAYATSVKSLRAKNQLRSDRLAIGVKLRV